MIVIVAVLLTQFGTIFGYMLLERRQPSATVAWLLAILFIPIGGVLIYWLLGSTKLRRAERRSERVEHRVQEVLRRHGVQEKLTRFRTGDAVEFQTQALLHLGQRLSRLSNSIGNRVTVHNGAAATYRAMIQAIEGARHHIHVEFYIIQPDRTGQQLRDRLVRRAREGLVVRVLYDAVGSAKLPNDFWKELKEAGGHAAAFAPLRVPSLAWLRRRDRIDFRNHRKIVVVDGEIGFTGGINVGREYLGLNPEFGHWRDTHLQVRGPAVLSLQRTFLEDWLRTTGELLDDARLFADFGETPPGDSVVQIVDSGPDRTFSAIRHVYFTAMTLARERLWVTSPYFVPDAVIEEALIAAALRGVDVRLLTPANSDHNLVSWASRSYYPRLLEAGVRIYEYARGFVHAKTLVVDDWLGSVGSANMDIRSFELNFELNAFVHGRDCSESLAGTFLADLRHARAITRESQRRLTYLKRLRHATARLLSPLL
jgi:cardiolipin synthase A/B